MWKCTSCDWSGENGDLKPATVKSGVQGMVKTFACPVCGNKVGDGVELVDPAEVKEVEDISQGISEAEEEVISEAQPTIGPTTGDDAAEEGGGTGYEDTPPQEPATGYEDTEPPAPSSVEESATGRKKTTKKTTKK